MAIANINFKLEENKEGNLLTITEDVVFGGYSSEFTEINISNIEVVSVDEHAIRFITTDTTSWNSVTTECKSTTPCFGVDKTITNTTQLKENKRHTYINMVLKKYEVGDIVGSKEKAYMVTKGTLNNRREL